MGNKKHCELRECFYCGIMAMRGEEDHFPIPQRLGGKDVVFACINCHDLKDRLPLDQWPSFISLMAIEQIRKDTKYGGYGAILFAKLTTMSLDKEASKK